MNSKGRKVSRGAIIADEASALAQYCPDLDNWPRSWSFDERDVDQGKRIVECFRPFLLHLLSEGLAAKTLRRHRDCLWMLGGEVIRRRHEDAALGRLAVEKATFALLEEDGGPLIWPRISEQEQDSFDATCRKFYRYLTATENTNK